jgi:hypothetical protein
MKKLRLPAIALAALLVIAFSACTVSISGYPRVAPNISATDNLYGQINVTWYPVSGAVAYNVYDSTNPYDKIYLGQGTLVSGTYYYYSDFPVYGEFFYQVESVFSDGGVSPLSAEARGFGN